MKKVFVFVLFLVSVSIVFGQYNNLDNVVQPAAHIDMKGRSFAGADTSYVLPTWCKGAELKRGSNNGIMCVHLVGDLPSTRYCMPLDSALNGQRCGALFDKIFFKNSTVVFDSVNVFQVINR